MQKQEVQPTKLCGFTFCNVELSSPQTLKQPIHFVSVTNQEFRVTVHEESVVLYNDVIFKCNIQSHVTDFVTVTGWVSSEGETYPTDADYGNCHETCDSFAGITI